MSSDPAATEPRLTIAIPLHGAARWIDTVTRNVRAAPASSRVVISDASHLDDSPARLARHFAGDARVTVVERESTLDWIDHANLLLGEAGTEYFCWLPQDDLVSPDGYFDLLVRALDETPTAVLAFPTVLRRVSKGLFRRRELEPAPFGSPPRLAGGLPAEAGAVKLLRAWNLGLAWRGVFRISSARQIPRTSFCPDVLWAFSMALAGGLVQVPEARYLKRFHRGSALWSMDWQGMETAKRLYRVELEARLGDQPARVDKAMNQVSRYLWLYRFRHQYMLLKGGFAGLLGLRRTVEE